MTIESPIEQWKPIRDYEDTYEISSFGRIRRVSGKNYAGHILATSISNTGYECVILFKDKHKAHKSVHRLVAEAFIPNPNNLSEVNHRDENKLNNVSTNLEWCTRGYNNSYGQVHDKRVAAGNRVAHLYKRSISQCTKEGDLIKVWPSASDAARELNLNCSNIVKALGGKIKSLGGFVWRYTND